MKITINNKDFASALSIGGAMAGRVKSMPILDCVKITVNGDNAIITSSNNECTISKTTCAASSTEQGAFCVNAKDIENIIKSIPDDEICLVIQGAACRIVYASGTMSIPLFSAEDFPIPPKNEDSRHVKVPALSLFKALKNAQKYVCYNDLRPVLTGVYVKFEGSMLEVAASDAHRLYYEEIELAESTDATMGAIIQRNAIPSILSVINGNDDIDLLFGINSLILQSSDATIRCAKIEGVYPNVKGIIPASTGSSVCLDKIVLKTSIERALLATDAVSMGLRLSVTADGVLKVEAENMSIGKTCADTIECTTSGFSGDFAIGCKGNFLLDSVNSLESDHVTMYFSTPSKAFLVLDSQHPKKKIVIMPIAIN